MKTFFAQNNNLQKVII